MVVIKNALEVFVLRIIDIDGVDIEIHEFGKTLINLTSRNCNKCKVCESEILI